MSIKLHKFRHSQFVRLITIFSSGFGAASLSLWALSLNNVASFGSFDMNALVSVVAGLAALAGGGCAHAFFIGADEMEKNFEGIMAIDPLTELLSKFGLEQQLATLIPKSAGEITESERWVMISIEIDSLREINELHGIDTGDEVLHVIGKRIRGLVKQLGPLARISGSEFALAIPISRYDRELQMVMGAIIDEVTMPVMINSMKISVFCTAGLTEIEPGEDSVDKLLRRTNLARNNARAGGLGNWAIYHSEMTQTDKYRKWIECELPHAIANNEFDLVYQSQVDSTKREVVGYEALIRWNHHEKGAIPPSEFIAVAEQCGLIGQIGEWVIRQACADMHKLQSGTTIAVNVSPKQLNKSDFVKTLSDIIESSGTDAKRLEIEITEGVLIQDHQNVRQKFEQVRALGCSIAIDDFGTGYSNLSYLSELPFTKLKIDRSFVAKLDHDATRGAMVATIVNMARALNVEILAEGVESETQIALLNAAGCRLMQGYYFGKPLMLDRPHSLAA